MISLRKHQSEYVDIVNRILSGEPITKVIGHITPGGGKSLFSLLSWPLIVNRYANALCWIVPRLTLAYQAEAGSMDPYFREALKHNMIIRSATNEYNPRRGQTGYTTTYQALAQDSKYINAREFEQRKYILILDEPHHVEDEGSWHKAIAPLVERCKFLILLSGTLNRGDENKIAFFDYIQKGNNTCLDLSPCEDTIIITYSRSDALKEKAILPIKFTLFDGDVEWEKQGKEFKTKLSKAYKNSGDAIQTALNTEFGNHIMKNGLDHWLNYKKDHPRSKLAIVAANIKHAKALQKTVQSWGFNALIATSDDNQEAIKAIKDYRYGNSDIMIFVMMCSEGLDIPPLTHIIALTHIRTSAWIEQLVARAVRVDKDAGPYENQTAFVFAMDDPPFRRVVEQIKKEQTNIIVNESEKSETPDKKKINGGTREPGITFLNGSVSGAREISLGEIPTGYAPPLTISEQEQDLRQQIEKHVNTFAFQNRHKPQKINTEIKTHFRKARNLMELSELESCLKYVKEFYPLNGHRNGHEGISQARTRRRRVPTKAVPWPG